MRKYNSGNAWLPFSSEFSVFLSAVEKHKKMRIYKTIILPEVLYGCETRYLALREENRMRAEEG
jgi:hypothetical protein